MTDSCHTCGNTATSCTLMNCKRCKTVAYCSVDCQRRDWKDHKQTCQRKDFAGAPCDCCGNTEDVGHGNMCINCGALSCKACNEQHFVTRDLSGEIVSFEPCFVCNKRINFSDSFSDCKKVEKLIMENPSDPRLARWLVIMGDILCSHYDDTSPTGEQQAKEHFLRAGELGLGEGFNRVAAMYAKHGNWDEARRYYRMAVDLMDVFAICILADEARQGFLQLGEIIQQDHRREPDYDEAFRLYREGARLGNARCSAQLGQCYLLGKGTEQQDFANAFKWSKKAAEKGETLGMVQCAHCYQLGKGVEQSTEQEIYWVEKYLELDDDERIRNRLLQLRQEMA